MTAQHVVTAVAFFLFSSQAPAADRVVYEGDAGPGKGKHILFVASDHEYRGEETCPAIARIMAKRFGFKCTVLFGQTEDGLIKQGSSHIPGIEAIDDADMLFLFLRFVHPDDSWMEKLEAYLKRGGGVLGLRTTTHAFNGLKGKYAYHNFNNGGALRAESQVRNGDARRARSEGPSRHARRQEHACDGGSVFGQTNAEFHDPRHQPRSGIDGSGRETAGEQAAAAVRLGAEL